MTEVEMAKEWIKDHSGLIGSYEYVKYDYDSMQQAFLAGLKAGRPQWHDLRKDPKDVPDEGTYLVVWQNARGYRDTMMMHYEENDEEELHWIDGDGDNWDDDVIAWREIPKFEEAAE